MTYHYTPITMAKIWNTLNTKWWWGCGATGSLIHYWWEYKMIEPLWKIFWWLLFLFSNKIYLTWFRIGSKVSSCNFVRNRCHQINFHDISVSFHDCNPELKTVCRNFLWWLKHFRFQTDVNITKTNPPHKLWKGASGANWGKTSRRSLWIVIHPCIFSSTHSFIWLFIYLFTYLRKINWLLFKNIQLSICPWHSFLWQIFEI